MSVNLHRTLQILDTAMATEQPPRKKRKLSHTIGDTKLLKLRHGTNGKLNRNKSGNVSELMQIIENEPNEKIEIRALEEIIKILKSQIKQNRTDYSLYLKLSWAYLRTGKYNDAISYFTQILPQRDHPKFYTLQNIPKTNKKHNNKNEPDDIKNAEEDSEDSDMAIYSKKKKAKLKKKKKKKLRRKKVLKRLNKLELNRPRINKNNIHSLTDESDDEADEKLANIPLKYEISIRVNIGLMLCRICDFEEAIRYTFIMRHLYKNEFENNKDLKYMQYDAYIYFIEMLVMYHQKYWYECIEKAIIILSHQNITETTLICTLDKHSLFELYCVLSDCYSRIGALKKADDIFDDIILNHIQSECGNKLDFSLKFHWIYEIYLRHLYHKKEWEKGHTLCMKLFASNISYRYSESMMKLCEKFNLRYYFNMDNNIKEGVDVYHFVIDAEHFGNQCRFVNHSNEASAINCIFTARYKYGNTSCPSAVEVWLKGTRKIEKGDELLVNYGEKYWENVPCCNVLPKREQWDDGFVFTHLVLDELPSYLDMKQIIHKHHKENVLLADKKYPNFITVKKDKYDGFGAFTTKTIKKDTFILRYAGIRKMCTNHDHSKSRYSIIQKLSN